MKCNIVRRGGLENGEIERVLAPNGKDSMLFKELVTNVTNGNKEDAVLLWSKVYTPTFKEWFGDWENNPKESSKVVDENGEPLMVYHGSNQQFEEFSKAKIGQATMWGNLDHGQPEAFYFTSNKHSAETYGKLYPIFLNIQNPNKLAQKYKDVGYGHPTRQNKFKDLQKLDRTGRDGLIVKDIFDPKSYDERIKEDMHGDTFAVFEPNQIKSVLNEGTFSTESNNMFTSDQPVYENSGTGGPLIDTFTAGPAATQSAPAKPYTIARPKLTTEEVIKKISHTVATQKAIWEKRKGNEVVMASLKNLEEAVKNKDEIVPIASMVIDAQRWLGQLTKKLKEVKDLVDSKDSMNEEEVHKALQTLEQTKNFAAAYTILNDINRLFETNPEMVNAIVKMIDSPRVPTAAKYIAELNEMIIARDRLLSNYLDYTVGVLTEWVYPFIDDVNTKLKESGNDKFVLTKEDIKQRFQEAPRDIGFLNSYLGAMINSNDAINSAVAKAIKWQMEKARLQDIDIQNDLLELYVKTDGPKNNPKAYNSKYLRTVMVPNGEDENGDTIFKETLGFIQDIDWDTFNYEKDKMYKAANKKYPNGGQDYARTISNWFKANQELRPDLGEYIAKQRARMSPEEFKAFLNRNTRDIGNSIFYVDENMIAENGKVYSGKFMRPNYKKYGNAKYQTLKNDPYYMKLLQTYRDANNKYAPKDRLQYGAIPQVVKTGFDGMVEDGLDITGHLKRVYEAVRTTFRNDEAVDTQYGEKGVQNLAGEKVNFLKVKYNRILKKQSELSSDLLTSVLLYSQSANNYDTLHDILPHVNALTTAVLGSKIIPGSGRKVVETIGGGVRAVINGYTGEKVTKTEEARVNARLKHFLDSIYWGHENLKIEMDIPVIGVVNVDKFFDKLGMLNALSTMVGNMVGGLNNVVIGNYNNLNEATTKRHMDIPSFRWGTAEYGRNLPNFIADLSKKTDRSLITLMVEHFDAMQGEFTDQYGRAISGSALKRAWNTSSLFLINNATEHEIQVSAFLGKAKFTKVKDKNGNLISLIDAYEKKDGKLKLKDGVQFTERDRFNFMNELHGMNKELQGNYNKFDRSVLQRYAIGRLVLMFRKYVYTGFKRRWAEEQVDYEQGSVTQGYYRTFIKTLAREIMASRWEVLYNWSNFSTSEKNALRQSLLDIGMWTAMFLLFGFLDDDDDKTKFEEHVLLQARRFQGDIAFFTIIGFKDMFRLMKTPAVAMDYIGKVADWLNQMAFEWDDEDMYYQRDSGPNKKGDSKAWAKFYKLAPGFRGWAIAQEPGEQLKVFNK